MPLSCNLSTSNPNCNKFGKFTSKISPIFFLHLLFFPPFILPVKDMSLSGISAIAVRMATISIWISYDIAIRSANAKGRHRLREGRIGEDSGNRWMLCWVWHHP